MSALSTLRLARRHLLSVEFVLLLSAMVVVLPLWVVERPPLQDLPQHVAAVRVLSSYHDPVYRFSEYFELTLGRTQYLTVYMVAAGLAKVVGPLVATKMLLSLSLGATPYCLARLMRALGHNPWLGLLSLPLVFNVHVGFGFLNFVAAIPLLFLGLEVAVNELNCPSARQAWMLGGVTLLTFLTHIVPFGILLVCVVALTRPERRAVLRRALVLGPAVVAAGLWLLGSPAGQVVGAMAFAGPSARVTSSYQSFGGALRAIPDWLTDIASADTDDLRLTIWFGLLLVLLVLATTLPGVRHDETGSELKRARVVLALVVPASLLAYVTLPAANGFIWPICQRFPVVAAMFSVMLLGRLPKAGQWLQSLVCVALASWGAIDQSLLFRAVEAKYYRGLDEVIDRVPFGSRVAALVFDRQIEGLRLSPLMHTAGWVQAARGGLVMFSFAEFPHSPFTYRPRSRPPSVAPRWEWTPERVKPDSSLLFYDYVLVHGWTGSLEISRVFERVMTRGRWSLWRRADRWDGSAVSMAE